MKAELVYVTPNQHVIFQLQDGSVVEFSPNPKVKEPSTMLRLLRGEPKIHIHLETAEGISLSGHSSKRTSSGLTVVGALLCGLLLGAGLLAAAQLYL